MGVQPGRELDFCSCALSAMTNFCFAGTYYVAIFSCGNRIKFCQSIPAILITGLYQHFSIDLLFPKLAWN